MTNDFAALNPGRATNDVRRAGRVVARLIAGRVVARLIASRVVARLIAVAVIVVPLTAQQTARDSGALAVTGTAVISGVVTADEPNGRPVRRAAVSVSTSESPASRMAITDDEGRFAVANLPAGRYTLRAEKPGWVMSYYGAKRPWRPPGVAIAVADGQRVTDVPMKLLRGAVVTGRIIDESGRPMVGVRPMVMEYRTLGGQRTLMRVMGSMTLLTQTDDRGEYRIFGLPPGAYFVAASPNPLTATGFRVMAPGEWQWAMQQGQAGAPGTAGPPPTGSTVSYTSIYYPGTADPSSAQMITLNAGQERSGVDFALRTVATANVEGIVTRPDGQPAINSRVTLTPMTGPALVGFELGGSFVGATADPRGRFTFRNVRPGRYTLTVRAASRAVVAPPTPGPGVRPAALPMDLWASTELSVNGQNIEGLTLALQPGSTVTGRVAFEASVLTAPTDLTRTRIQMSPPPAAGGLMLAETNFSSAPATANGTFTLPGIAPGNYTLAAFIPAPAGSAPGTGWTLKSVVVRDRDVADSSFDVRAGEDVLGVVVTFTDRASEISGNLLDAAGRGAPEYYVFLFPTDKTMWTPSSRRFRSPVRPANDGRFRFASLPPGEYYLAALTDFDEKDMLDASFIEQILPAAIKITLGEGEKKVQDLKITGG